MSEIVEVEIELCNDTFYYLEKEADKRGITINQLIIDILIEQIKKEDRE